MPSLISRNGNDYLNKIKGSLVKMLIVIMINYSQTENSNINMIVTFEDLIKDLNELKTLVY